MAVWKRVIAGFKVVINDIDHEPPHCHVQIGRHNAQVDLDSLEIFHPPPFVLPSKLRKGLREVQEEMLEAWEIVTIIPLGGPPEWTH